MQDSLKKRYLAKLSAKLAAFALGFVTIGMVPRALGPVQYGNFGFATTFFQNVMKFLSMGTTTAFYTKLSQRLDDQKLIAFYAIYVLMLLTLMAIGIASVFVVDARHIVWPDQVGAVVLAAAVFAVLGFVSNLVHQINDAYGLTVNIERFFILQSVLSTFLILVLYMTDMLSLFSYFLANYAVLGFTVAAGWRLLRSRRVRIFEQWQLTKREIAGYSKEFYRYSLPLFVHSLVVLIMVIGDRWLLQHFAGSKEQGFFTFAFKIGAMCFLFTSSMTPLLIREMSISHRTGDLAEMRRLFLKFIPLFYVIAVYLAVFISMNAEDLIFVIGGETYREAALGVAIMALYPIHQTYGQLSGSVFLATGRTRVLRNINAWPNLVGLIVSYFLLASPSEGGMGLGATGLAGKMIGIQIFVVNVQLWFNAKYLGLPFIKLLGHQIAVLILIGILAWGAKNAVLGLPLGRVSIFLLNGIIYTIGVMACIIFFPRIIAMTRREIFHYFNYIGHRWKFAHGQN